ncbi:hypothetical protein E3N88_44588 [Mikania micrantha]|uniref:Uncharacterized protein n=1 Tax=Mikania micrantha TaxID=192012 RepID=A0A5N6LBU2_9ASTR|nr:hypothetical protein E3N88_44588 [Mikania micrantha]
MKTNHTHQFPPSIYMAPSVLLDLSPSSFNPQLVSIGPLHREDENVKAFERQKISYLINLMSYINSPQEEILESCMQKAYSVINKIKGCYIWTKAFTDSEIAEMMVMDACFMLGLMIKINPLLSENSYMGKELQLGTIMNDLVLLENQIPLFFLDEMFQCTVMKLRSDISFIQLIKPVIVYNNLFKAKLKFDNDDVAKLVESKVLVNITGSNEEVANMLNNIGKNVTCVDSYYEQEWEILNKYCKGIWPKHIATMRRTYFSSPWSIIALVAGIILFVLQVLQTIFTIKSQRIE